MKTLKTNMAAINFKSLRDFIILSYGTNLMDDLEFILLMITVVLCKFTFTKSIAHLIWKYLMKLTEFSFRRKRYCKAFWSTSTASQNSLLPKTVANNNEVLRILLKRLSYPCNLSDMVPLFRRNPTEICRFSYLLSHLNQDILQSNKRALYCNVIDQKGAPLQNCFEFVDRIVLKISQLKIKQNNVYNSHKWVHSTKFQNLAQPNKMPGNLSGPHIKQRHDSTMLHESWLLTRLQGWSWYNN